MEKRAEKRDWKPINRIVPGDLLRFVYRDSTDTEECYVDSIGIHDTDNSGTPRVCINGTNPTTGRRRPYVLDRIDLFSVEAYRRVSTRIVEWRSEDGTLNNIESITHSLEPLSGNKDGKL